MRKAAAVGQHGRWRRAVDYLGLGRREATTGSMGGPGRHAGGGARGGAGLEVNGAEPDHGGAVAAAGDEPCRVAAVAYGATAAGSGACGVARHEDAVAEGPRRRSGGGDTGAWLGTAAERGGWLGNSPGRRSAVAGWGTRRGGGARWLAGELAGGINGVKLGPKTCAGERKKEGSGGDKWRRRWLYIQEEYNRSQEYNIAPFDGTAKILRRRSWDAEATAEEKSATDALMKRIHELQNTRGQELLGVQITSYFLRIRV
nr:uncharacterized protein LOC127339811 [Lolium perenne]